MQVQDERHFQGSISVFISLSAIGFNKQQRCVALAISLLFKDHRGLSEEIYYVIDTQMTLDPMTWDFYGPSTSHIDFQPKQKSLNAIREMTVVFNVRDSFCTHAHHYESFRDRNR